MNHTTKYCSYTDCDNSSARDGQMTFFSFPLKNAEKCETWASLAGVPVPTTKQYLCEVHFNPIYLSRTQRRVVLLPTAVPYAYGTNVKDTTSELDNSEASAFEPSDVMEEHINFEQNLIGETDSAEEGNTDSAFGDEPGMEKRPNLELSTLSLNNVTKRQKLTADSDLKIPRNSDKFEATIDNTVGNLDIVTFMFRDEEYIQMTKSVYLQQRADMINKLQKYKEKLAVIKRAVLDDEIDE